MFDPKTRVLIVDDMMTMRKIVSKVCGELGFTDITLAADGALGFQALCDAKPPIGLVISDWTMPNCTGLNLLKRVRGDQRFSKLPFVMVTAESEKAQIMEALTAGVSDYVIKPFTSEGLGAKIKNAYDKMLKAA